MGKAARLKQQRREARAAAPPARGGHGWIVVLAVVSLGLGSVALAAAMILPGEGGSSATNGRTAGGGGLARLQMGPPPWFPEELALRDRVEEIGVPFAAMEGTAVHIHPRLRVVANGKAVLVPSGIGISYAGMAALHTHDEIGTIHVESPVPRDYTLGQFFDVWGVRLTKTCMGGFCAGGGKQLRVFVDGEAIGGNPRALELADGEQIAVTYGTRKQIERAAR